MEAHTKTLTSIFQTNALLTIPFFQRQYVWKKENLDTLLDDIDIVYESSQASLNKVHFMGSVILKREALHADDASNNIMDRWSIIDGQQRLTTLMVLLKVLHLLANKSFAKKYQTDNDNEDPLIFHNRSDKPLFDKIVKKTTTNNNLLSANDILTEKDEKLYVNGEDNRLASAFYYFLNYYTRKFSSLPTIAERERMASTYINIIAGMLQFICIELSADEDEQKIFDTINSLGVKLTTGELLKNFFFSSADEGTYDSTWAPVFESGNAPFWSEIITKGTKQESNIEQFFYAYMLVKMWDSAISLTPTEKKIFRKKENLFENYKNLVAGHNVDKGALVNEIVSYAKKYHIAFEDDVMETLIPENACLPRLRVIMQASNTSTLLPYLLYIQENVADAVERNKIYGYLESYLVRRIICKSKTNSYSDLFSENLINSGVKTCTDLKAYIDAKQPGDNLSMPSDADVLACIQENDLRKEAALILYLLQSKSHPFRNNALNGGLKSYISDPLMPVNNANWPASSDPEKRETLVKTLGNQILLRMSSNLTKRVRESDYASKKAALNSYSAGVPFSESVFANADWTDASIILQNTKLAQAINMCYPA